MNTSKKILIGGLLLAGGLTAPVVYDEVQKVVPLSEEKTIERIETLQSSKQKFEQLLPQQIEERIGKTPYRTEVIDYVGPQGSGYQVIFYKTEQIASTSGEIIEVERTKVIGYGAEAKQLTHDWQ